MNDQSASSDFIDSETAKQKAKAGSKHGRFQKLATSRTKKALKAIRLLAGMGRSPAYEYSSDEAAKIVAALEGEIAALKRTINEPGRQLDIEFDL